MIQEAELLDLAEKFKEIWDKRTPETEEPLRDLWEKIVDNADFPFWEVDTAISYLRNKLT